MAKLKQRQIVQDGVLKEVAAVGVKPMKGELGGAGPFRGVVAEAEDDLVVRLEGRPWWEAERAKKQEREESRANFERGRR